MKRRSKTKEAFYRGWQAGCETNKLDQDDPRWQTAEHAWREFEERLALRPSFSQVCERVVVLFCVLAVLGFVVAPLLIKLEWVAR